ncbi:sigma-70 family RNA polymerase sigma factor [Desulforhopalus sp. IMCC35007]|uniref:sigma-70 family RNA polymerase sigma factor n=1 Tax=Desulforhopalus sp. IMCC35007 TaxID=2569543 RepID=UPI0010AE9C00|nr:sigma-70 family RNA polymerase sigma factor [Desulforhopalus sp. IMCC35007]TKB05985.1 sigma-70 family RNA polymerase sigma factor [Desulforhopalus sp. IMCC35007]
MYNASSIQAEQIIKQPVDVVDLLATEPSVKPFQDRVGELCLSGNLELKIKKANSGFIGKSLYLTENDEKELATEVLLLRHKFTESVWRTAKFNQAAITIIQNIYLFRLRKIFFDPTGPLYEQERVEALYLFSSYDKEKSLPLNKTFQHLILARVWNRIVSQSSREELHTPEFIELQQIVEKLNTVRNIYMLLTTGLVKKIVGQLGKRYDDTLASEDAWQIGSIGVARAAYRYHHSCGIRFSTYAANWIQKEVQRQALQCRLIRISAHTVEQYSLAKNNNDPDNLKKYLAIIEKSTCISENVNFNASKSTCSFSQCESSQEEGVEVRELQDILVQIINSALTEKEAEIIKRKFGLAAFAGSPQSVISISTTYGVTRSSIYQIENKALTKLRRALVALKISKEDYCTSTVG